MSRVLCSYSTIRPPGGGRCGKLCFRMNSVDHLAKVAAFDETLRNRLAALALHSPTPALIFDGDDHRITIANARLLDIVRGRDVIGRPVLEAFPELRGQPILKVLDQVRSSGEHYTAKEFLIRFDRGDGVIEDRYFSLDVGPVRETGRGVTGLMVVGFEVTEQVLTRRDAEMQSRITREALARAEQASRAKDEFLAMLGHELRNPLSPILTALQLMRMRGQASREHAVIERQVEHLVRLVDDLLDVSRITRGKIELRRQRVELSEVVSRAVEIASPLLEERRQRLLVDVPRRGLALYSDPERLAQVVSNLLTNSAKYSEPGGCIEVTAGRARDAVSIRVKDSGVGIAPEMLGRIFDLFVQQPQAKDRALGGLGLGLAIVRSLVELHGGRVRAESAGVGRGSEFLVELPAASAALEASENKDAGSEADPAEVQAGDRILVVDDNEDAAHLLADALKELGYVVRVAADGPSALRIAGEFRPNTALLDIGLPVMDGHEVARRLRGMPWAGDLRLVAITGYGQASDRRASRAAGFDAHLVKPVDLDKLASVIEDLRRTRAARGRAGDQMDLNSAL